MIKFMATEKKLATRIEAFDTSSPYTPLIILIEGNKFYREVFEDMKGLLPERNISIVATFEEATNLLTEMKDLSKVIVITSSANDLPEDLNTRSVSDLINPHHKINSGNPQPDIRLVNYSDIKRPSHIHIDPGSTFQLFSIFLNPHQVFSDTNPIISDSA